MLMDLPITSGLMELIKWGDRDAQGFRGVDGTPWCMVLLPRLVICRFLCLVCRSMAARELVVGIQIGSKLDEVNIWNIISSLNSHSHKRPVIFLFSIFFWERDDWVQVNFFEFNFFRFYESMLCRKNVNFCGLKYITSARYILGKKFEYDAWMGSNKSKN